MASLGMSGPYTLSVRKINEMVTKKSPGNYALGYSKDRTFYVKYVGRSDDNVNSRLQDWVGEYKEFKFSYASSAKAAYEKECRNYHDFGGPEGDLDNETHPAKPSGSHWRCPVCGR